MAQNKVEGDNLTRRGRGRPKGSRNKTTAKAKEIIEAATDTLGGAERLVEWAKEDPANERVFWGTIFPKLMPLQVTGDSEAPLIHRVEMVAVKPRDDAQD